ncbi:RHE_PE00001 family protein [Pseudochelatococcus sp. B33]
MTDARDDGVPDVLPPGDIPWPRLAGPLVAAEDALARLDERLRASPLRDGFTARMHYADACASLWIEGELVPVEDLVLHDASADIRAPTPQLTRARAVMQVRRLIAERPPDWALSRDGIAHLSGETLATPSRRSSAAGRDMPGGDAGLNDALSTINRLLVRTSRVLSGEAVAARAGASPDRHPVEPDAWRRAAEAVAHLPPLLAAGLLWDRWETHPPVPRRGWLGRQLIAAYLRERGKAGAHLPAVNAGLRAIPWERRRSRDRSSRLLAWLEAAHAGAQAGLAEHDRLTVALALLERKCAARRTTSRLPDLVALAAARPLVTAATAAQALGITRRAAQKLITELGLREATGRGRYRAWMV